MNRTAKDQSLIKTKAYPAAASTAYTDFIDLGSDSPGIKVEDLEFRIEGEAVPSLADAKTATLTLHDSADGATSAAIAGLATLVQTGAGGAGAAAVSRDVRFPSSVRRYVRLACAVASAGGDSTAKKFTLSVLK